MSGQQAVFAGESQMAALMRALDWSATALGPVSTWSTSLKTTVGVLLGNRFPMCLFWGPELCNINNDAYRPILGDKHPASLGAPARRIWSEIWHIIGPLAESVMAGGRATWNEHLFLPMNRRGYVEETYFTFSYSPVPDDDGRVGGVLVTCQETTEQVQGDRQLRMLRELAARSGQETSAEAACATAARTFANNDADIPFALLYLLAAGSRRATLTASVGFDAQEIPAEWSEIALDDSADPAREVWPFREVLRVGREVEVSRFCGAVRLPSGHWEVAPARALVLPLTRAGQREPWGFMVAGVSPHRALDDRYRSLFRLSADHVATGIGKARAYEDERRRAEALAEIDRAKTRFFSNISHEFRTPLTLMLAPQEDALATPARALVGAELEAVHRNTLRLLRLVNALLDFSRIEAGRAQACYQPTDLARLTCDLASAFRSAIERGGLRFEVDCPPLPEPVYVDRDMWEKIVLNLLSNAFKFTFAGSIAVIQRIEGDHVALEVRDTGLGIPQAELPRVFERFHRVERARGRTHEGSGIGLALVQDLVKQHGGSIEVESQTGVGTTFSIRLPRGSGHLPADRIEVSSAQVERAAGAEPFVAEALRWLPANHVTAGASAVAGDGPRERAMPGEPRVLVVDDNADMRDYLTRLLAQRFAVEGATDGMHALEIIRQRPPDLILTDVMMPNLDGFGLLAAVRGDARTASVPVIMLSARAGAEAQLEGLHATADDYLVKPFSARELLARVQVNLEKARLRRAADAERDRLRSLLSQVPAVVNFLRGPELVFEFAHPLAIQAFGGRDVVGKPLLEALPEFRQQEFPRLLHQVLTTGERLEGKERLVLHDDGQGGLRESYWSFVYLPVRNDEGRIEGAMTFDLDVTAQVLARRRVEEQARELEQANREAQRARAAAESASRAKDEFLAMLGHELRNPLSPIVTSLQLMRMRGLETREQTVIERQVQHLVRLVDDLLDISRITRGKIELRKTRLQLGQVVFRGLEIASPLLEQRRQQVDIQVSPEGLAIDADPDRLAQVVSNLLTNAAKYSEPGSTVHIAAERAGRCARLRVRDEGIGISPDLVHKVFDLFFQEAQSLDRSKGGLGLGLAIVRSLVELHGGSVAAASAGSGRGSEFTIDLPLARGADELASAAGNRKTQGGLQRVSEQMAKRVLVVDDNVDAAESIADLLRDLGHRVETAADGPQALNVARKLNPEVCLVDIGLPVMDGYELARRLRQSRDLARGARLIAVTGYGHDRDKSRSEEAGFDGHLVKPVPVDVLTRVVID